MLVGNYDEINDFIHNVCIESILYILAVVKYVTDMTDMKKKKKFDNKKDWKKAHYTI